MIDHYVWRDPATMFPPMPDYSNPDELFRLKLYPAVTAARDRFGGDGNTFRKAAANMMLARFGVSSAISVPKERRLELLDAINNLQPMSQA